MAFVSGAVSGTTAALATSPFDVLKTRRQALVMSGAVGTSASGSQAVGMASVLKEIIAREGVSALYAGIMPRIVKIAPACGIMIACFEVRPYALVSSYMLLTNGTTGYWKEAEQIP